jgi:polyhydroxyalkanoate synthase
MLDSMNPRNFPFLNPDIIEETLSTQGQNLLKGMENLTRDIENGFITMVDSNAFEIGRNIAITKGQVSYRNNLMELIRFEPTTNEAYAEPLLIIPPWINKYYILDLAEENSFIKWLVGQGHKVYCISWVNPDASHAHIGFEDYITDGVMQAAQEIQSVEGANTPINAMGYCIGGTLLGLVLASLSGQNKSNPFQSATFLTTLLDFEHAGDIKNFIGVDQLESLNSMIAKDGVMDGRVMSLTFSLLRSSDLIWNFVINNYFLGREPMAFDLLYWNSDVTNLPAAMHMDYLKSFYMDNALAKGEYKIFGQKLDLKTIKTPAYFLATQDDHIAPHKAVKEGAALYGGAHEYVLAGSGHIAGVINPPHKNKYGYEANGEKHEGSWWLHWQKWINSRNKGTKHKPIGFQGKTYGNAPGTYVFKKHK